MVIGYWGVGRPDMSSRETNDQSLMGYLNIVSNDKQKSSQKLQAPSVFLPISISILPMYPRHAETQARLQQQTKELFSMTLLLGIREGHIFLTCFGLNMHDLHSFNSSSPLWGCEQSTRFQGRSPATNHDGTRSVHRRTASHRMP